jgi:iron-sulfur cluster repair protein YtfE (RIC family)
MITDQTNIKNKVMPPIKRHIALQPVSHDHHQGLLVCWKIRTGIAESIEPERIKAFVDFYYNTHLLEHFRLEEEFIFPILGNKNELVIQAYAEHGSIIHIINLKDDLAMALIMIERQLQAHIRFEERILFNEVQKIATEEELAKIAAIHSDNKEMNQQIESWQDNFWEQNHANLKLKDL